MNDNSSEECIICFNKILYPNDQIVLNCFHKLCAECYYRIIYDPQLLQKCPVCRHDIFDNLNNSNYISMDNLPNPPNTTNSNTIYPTTIDPITIDPTTTYQNPANSHLFVCYKMVIALKNTLLFFFVVSVCIFLVLILGIISKTIYK